MSETRRSSLQERLEQVRKELTGVKADLREITRSGRLPMRRSDLGPAQKPVSFARTTVPSSHGAVTAGGRPSPVETQPSGRGEAKPMDVPRRLLARDERFVDYLSASIQVGKPLRSARQTQRNIVIALLIVLVLAALWVAGMLL